jgi:thymidylate synthase
MHKYFLLLLLLMEDKKWPIFYKDGLKFGSGDVGVCTLWTKQQIVHQTLDESTFSVVGNLYTIQGINPMIKNILAKPKIRKIILCGADLMKSGQALLNLMKEGIDENRKIIGSPGYIDSDIPLDVLANFRKNVEIIDMRGREKLIPEQLSNMDKQEPFMEPLFLRELEKTTFPLYTKEPFLRVSGKSLTDTWIRVLDLVMKYGNEIQTDYKIRSKDVTGLVAVIREHEEEGSSQFMDISEINNYFNTIFSPRKPEGIEYTYGERLFSYQDIDQVDHVIKKLKDSPISRRAVAVTWNVLTDKDSKEPPCLTQIVWNIKNNRLYQTCFFRSHDIYGAWLLNAYAMQKIQQRVAKELGIESGHLVMISNSAHVYEQSWNAAEEIVHSNYRGKLEMLEEDENGYFVITLEDGEIIIQHHVKDGRKSDYSFRGTNAQNLYKQVVHENLFSKFDHAAYVGYELARAEHCLKSGEKFVQDQA